MAATVEENLITFLKSDTTLAGYVGDRIFDNAVSTVDVTKGDYILFQLSDTADEYCLDDSPSGPFRYFYDLEYWSKSVRTARIGALRAQTILNKARGTFGDSTVQGIFAESQDEDYIPRDDGSDRGFHGNFLKVEIVP